MIPTIRVAEIQSAVIANYGVTLDDLIGESTCQKHARPRMVAMYLCRTMAKRSLPDIGNRFGGRHHTTALSALQRIRMFMRNDPELAARVNMLEAGLMSEKAATNLARLDPSTAAIRIMEAA